MLACSGCGESPKRRKDTMQDFLVKKALRPLFLVFGYDWSTRALFSIFTFSSSVLLPQINLEHVGKERSHILLFLCALIHPLISELHK